jgi:hypothetical protein
VTSRRSIAAGGAAVAVVLATVTAPQANAAGGLADWLTKASVQVTEIHKAETDAVAAIKVEDQIDFTGLEAACRRLETANTALAKTLPTPDPPLTAEVQQAVDNFESATQSCSQAVRTKDTATVNQFGKYLTAAERHLVKADAIIVKLPPG